MNVPVCFITKVLDAHFQLLVNYFLNNLLSVICFNKMWFIKSFSMVSWFFSHCRYQSAVHIQYCFCSVFYNQYRFSTFHFALDTLESRKRTPPLHSSNYFYKIWWHTISLLNLHNNTPNSVPSRTDLQTNICIRTFIRDNSRHQRYQVVYIYLNAKI